MKSALAFILILALTSCGQITRIMDGTENLPKQIQETNDGMKKTNEAIRKQKMGVAFEILKNEKMRANLVPIPFNMMSAAKTMAEALTAEEAVLFVKNYVSDLNKSQVDTVYPPMDEEKFEHERQADLFMIILISGFLPETTVTEIIEKESNSGENLQIMLNILRLRVYFNNDMMLFMATLGLDANVDATGKHSVLDDKSKLDTLGKIEKAIKYNEIIEFICNLDFADQVDAQITGFKFIKPLDKALAKNNWALISERAQSDFKAQSLSKDPAKNEAETKDYAVRYKALIEKIKDKSGGTKAK